MLGDDYSLFRLGKRGMFIGAMASSALILGLSACGDGDSDSSDNAEANNVHVSNISNIRTNFTSEDYSVYRYCDGNNTIYNVAAKADIGESMSIVPNDPRCHNGKFTKDTASKTTTYNLSATNSFHSKRACDDNIMIYVINSQHSINIKTVVNDPRCKS